MYIKLNSATRKLAHFLQLWEMNYFWSEEAKLPRLTFKSIISHQYADATNRRLDNEHATLDIRGILGSAQLLQNYREELKKMANRKRQTRKETCN